jgi:hypothetical protein
MTSAAKKLDFNVETPDFLEVAIAFDRPASRPQPVSDRADPLDQPVSDLAPTLERIVLTGSCHSSKTG